MTTILWFRKDLRLDDNPALQAAIERGGPIIPVFIYDETFADMGAAPKWRLEKSLFSLEQDLKACGARLVYRQGDARNQIINLVKETEASAVFWGRQYDPIAQERDSQIKADLKEKGTLVKSYNNSLLREPWEIETKTGGFYKVFTPFYRAHIAKPEPRRCYAAPRQLLAPEIWPSSDDLETYQLSRDMHRGGSVVEGYTRIGTQAALHDLSKFLETVDTYQLRDRLDKSVCSGLSENLAWGEISPNRIYHTAHIINPNNCAGFLRQLIWRDFAYHLLFYTPHILQDNWRPEWQGFPWRPDNEDAEKWRRGETGEPVVDAAMRELYVTGIMHNRARMLTASYLTKHLLVDWRVGRDWFAECLIDWDIANNAMGWQWVAGCGPDASPYFRIFNPRTQAEKFDPIGSYQNRFLNPSLPDAKAFYNAAPKSWKITSRPDVTPLIELAAGRIRALDAYGKWRTENGK